MSELQELARATRKHVEEADLPRNDTPTGSEHIKWMLSEVESGSISGEKAHRWIGYVHGVLVSNGVDLEEVKDSTREVVK